MNENYELILYIYQSSEMGVYTVSNLINLLANKENKIKPVLERQLKEYEKYMSTTKKILEKNDINPKNTSFMTKMMSSIGIKMETIRDNSDTAMIQMLMEGINMGVVDIISKINKYRLFCSRNTMKIANQYLKFQEKELESLKKIM